MQLHTSPDQKILAVPFSLADYAPEMAGQVCWVWVNPPVEMMLRMTRLYELWYRAAMAHEGSTGKNPLEYPYFRELLWGFSDLLSKGPEGTQISEHELLQFYNQCAERDPQLWPAFQNKLLRTILEFTRQKRGIYA